MKHSQAVMAGAIASVSLSLTSIPVSAQITPDNTLGIESSILTPNISLNGQVVDLIQGGSASGNNLLHSFLDFNVDLGKSVYFDNPAGIEAIFSRVTGNNISEIFGTLGVNGNADLFLFNRNGIIFGADATLDIAGSFLASTATDIELGDGSLLNILSAAPNALLSINPNSLFNNALRNHQGQINSDTGLTVGNRLHFSAQGSLEIQGDIKAEGGITLFTTEGDLTTENISSSSLSLFSSNSSSRDGGDISLSTTEGDITTSNIDASSGSYFASNSSSGDGGNISLSTTQGNITTSVIDSSSGSISDFSSSSGNGGDIYLSTTQGNIATSNIGSASSSFSSGSSDSRSSSGNGGDIYVATIQGHITTGAISSASRSFSDFSSFSGDGGGIFLSTNQGDITTTSINSSSVSSSDANSLSNNGGELSLSTSEGDISTAFIDSFSFSSNGSASNGGAINLSAQDGNIIGVDSPLFISSSISGSQGNAALGGNVTLEAKDRISDIEILTLSSDSQSGVVQVAGTGNLTLANMNIITSKQLEIEVGVALFSTTTTTFDVGEEGQSGDVFITSLGDLSFQNSTILSETNSNDLAGNVIINSQGLVTFNQSNIKSGANSTGDAGSINIEADEGVIFNDTQSFLSTETNALGKAGNITIDTPLLTVDNGAEISTATKSRGKAGDILFNTDTLNVFNGGQIFAFSEGAGDGGTITVNAPIAVNLGEGVQDASPVLSVETSNVGKAGNIFVNTPVITISDTARLTATATATATNSEGGGSITISADQMNLAGVVGIFAETQGNAPAGRLLLKPYQNNPNLDIDLFAGSKISAATSGSGNGGDLVVTAPNNIDISGAGILSVETSSSGDAGTIAVTSKNLALRDGVTLSASTAGSGDGGFIKFTIAEDINIFDSFVKAITTENSTGTGGSIDIDPINTNLNLVNARIAVDSQGQGIGGDIFVTSDFLNLYNSAIATETFSSDGGNLFLDIGSQLFLRNGSNITATAGLAKKAGNGGNITVLAPTIIASANEDNNIFADAFSGLGGRIFVSVNQLVNIGFQTENIPVRNDITASSEIVSSRLVLSPRLTSRLLASPIFASRLVASPLLASLFNLFSGSVIIESEVEENNELPNPLVDPSHLIDRRCLGANAASLSKFSLVGRGGRPPQPTDIFDVSESLEDIGPMLGELLDQKISESTTAVMINSTRQNDSVAQAQYWRRSPEGQIQLASENSPLINGEKSRPNTVSFAPIEGCSTRPSLL